MPLTVGDLKRELSAYDDDCELYFGDEDCLTFYGVKQPGEKLVQIEFEQAIFRNEDGQLVIIELKDHTPAPE
jgi:hypothetical protein